MFKPRKTLVVGGTVCFAVSLFAGATAHAQQSDGSPATVNSSNPSPVNAPLEDRIAAARSVKVLTSILGIELGSELDEAHEKLDQLCAPGTRPKEEGEDKEVQEQKGKNGDEHERSERKAKSGEEEEEGHKVLWQLAGTDYSAIYITADDKERVDSITAFLRPGKEMPFDAVGEVSKAPVRDGKSVVWDVLKVDHPLFRVVASGADGKAASIRLFVVRRSAGEPIPYKGEERSEPH